MPQKTPPVRPSGCQVIQRAVLWLSLIHISGGKEFFGVCAEDVSSADITDSKIRTSGAAAHGVYAGDNSNVSVGNTAIMTSGNDSYCLLYTSVFNIMLQLLEDGRLTDGHGHVSDFRNCVVIMTSNIGASDRCV